LPGFADFGIDFTDWRLKIFVQWSDQIWVLWT